jgi:endonuclease/exonuclease/phosphatase family metal-dependent hydrolase
MKNSPMLTSVLIAALTVCAPAQADTEADAPVNNTLRVMVWNVLHGANDVTQGAEKALKIIRDTAPDIVLLQESYDIDGDRPKLGAWLAEELGWHEHQAQSKHLCVLTPLKIETTFFHHEWHGVGARLRDASERELLVWSTWIDWRSFITYTLRDTPGISDEDLLAGERIGSNRQQQADAIIAHLRDSGQLAADVPLLVGGDWNCPSHLDWTLDASRVYKRRRVLSLPVSVAMQRAGFTDTFRDLYPNPVQRPGITWSPMFRTKGEGDAQVEQGFERIDRLYLKNPVSPQVPEGGWVLRPVSGHVLPIVWEDDSIPVVDRQFPSDHGAVVIELVWERASTGPASE